LNTEQVNETKLVLKYDDSKGSFTFKDFIPATEDEDLYEIAVLLNSLQDTPVHKIVKITTKIVTSA
jgi:hypothetical protein